jgi:Flp pilus assembly protein TadG
MMSAEGPRAGWGRRGNILALTAVLSPVLIGMMAFSADLAVISAARGQLRTSADAAALAGAQELATRQRLQMYPAASADVAAALGQAVAYAGRNNVLGVPSKLDSNPSNLDTGTQSVVAGYLARPYDATAPFQTSVGMIPYYNAVQVRAVRDATHGGAVPAFFSRLWGRRGTSLQVTATAAAVGLSGFRAIDASTNANLLPIVLDKTTYAQMLRGNTTDEYTFNATTKTVTPGADGVTESRLYPVRSGYPGNWGTIKIGVANNSTQTLGQQIRYGVTPAQMATYPNGMIQPNPTTGLIQFEGNPGISAGLKDDLASIIGKPVEIPIYDAAQSGGNGNNAIFTITAFAPVRLLKVTFRGKDKYVVIQPAGVPRDPTAVWGGIRDGLINAQFRLVLVR